MVFKYSNIYPNSINEAIKNNNIKIVRHLLSAKGIDVNVQCQKYGILFI